MSSATHTLGTVSRPAAPTVNAAASLPLYAASLLVTLAGIGAVGATVSFPAWTGVWATLAVIGHLVSFGIRRFRPPGEVLFYVVMVFGWSGAIYLAVIGSPLVGMDQPLSDLPPDMATALLLASMAVVRAFTLTTDGALLFSPVPAISMLALVGGTNPNAEIPLFFGLLILGSVFLLAYHRHLERTRRVEKPVGPVLLHVIAAWAVTLATAAGALLFPVVVQPVLSRLSPFSFPVTARLPRAQAQGQSVPIGQGPINLSNQPVYKVYCSEAGLFRTGVFTGYTGQTWTPGEGEPAAQARRPEEVTEFRADAHPDADPDYRARAYRFRFPRDPDLAPSVPVRTARQVFVPQASVPSGIPGLGRIVDLLYPRAQVMLHWSGFLSGSGHQGIGRDFEVVSEIPDYPVEVLRSSPPVDPATFVDRETLSVRLQAQPLRELAQKVTAGIESPYERIQRIMQYVEKTCRYTLDEEPTPPGEDATCFYLFQTKRGACALSASAVALMCRSVNVPARVAVGYVADEALPGGDGYMLRQEHAHMWVEAYLSGCGWVAFNPSPPLVKIHDNPLQVLWHRIQRFFSRIGGGGLDAVMLLAVIAATLALAARAAWARWGRRILALILGKGSSIASEPDRIVEAYRRALRLLERRGWRREPWMTPREYAASLAGSWGEGSEAAVGLERLTHTFERARYAGEGTAEDVAAAASVVTLLSRQAPARPRPARGRAAQTAPGPA
jgi:transglutaminase-like putative cysteine protease